MYSGLLIYTPKTNLYFNYTTRILSTMIQTKLIPNDKITSDILINILHVFSMVFVNAIWLHVVRYESLIVLFAAFLFLRINKKEGLSHPSTLVLFSFYLRIPLLNVWYFSYFKFKVIFIFIWIVEERSPSSKVTHIKISSKFIYSSIYCLWLWELLT